MLFSAFVLIGSFGLSLATPIVHIEARTVTSLDASAVAQAQQRDNTATRAVTGSTIKTSSGQCLFVDPLSGDFRENLTPIQIANCDGSQGQNWDVLTSGKHINISDDPDAAGSALIVSDLTNACFNFDPRRAAGNQVLLFSCGGRADGDSKTTSSQLFPFKTATGTITFSPKNAAGKCFTAKGKAVDIANCDVNDVNQQFTFGGSGSSSVAATGSTAAANNGQATQSSATSIAPSATATEASECEE